MNREENKTINIREYTEGAEMLESLPRVVYLEATNTCNLACPMCPIAMGVRDFVGKEKFFDYDMLHKMEDFLKSAEICVMSAGGEPLLHPRFIDMVRFVKSRGASVVFNTNATVMDESKSRALVKLETDSLSFSVDAANSEIYPKIRVGGDLEKVKENIKTLVGIKREAASEKPYLNLQMTLMKANLPDIPAVVELAAGLDIGRLVIEPLSPVFSSDDKYARFVRENAVSLEEALPAVRVAKDRAGELGISFSSHYLAMAGDEHHPSVKGLKCAQPWINFGVRADGRVFPCCGASETMGDIKETSPADVWNGKGYRALRRRFAQREAPDFCRLCIEEGRAMFFNAGLVEAGP